MLEEIAPAMSLIWACSAAEWCACGSALDARRAVEIEAFDDGNDGKPAGCVVICGPCADLPTMSDDAILDRLNRGGRDFTIKRNDGRTIDAETHERAAMACSM